MTTLSTHSEGESIRVAVLGAGVSGLTVANHLLKLLHASGIPFHITIIARHWPDNYDKTDVDYPYTSPWAGANWRSLEEKNKRIQALERDTFGYLMEHGKELEGITELAGMDYYGYERKDDPPPWFWDLCPEFEEIPQSDLPPHVAKGWRFRSFTFNVPRYLAYLLQGVQSSPHVTFKHATLNTYPSGYDVVINCTGLSAGRLDIRETGMYPIRGQTVKVWAPQHMTSATFLVRPGVFRYAIPRGDGYVILGGTLGVGDYDATPKDEQGAEIARECVQTWKTLEGMKVIDNRCGLRPARKGGLRLEKETRNGTTVIHNYGHGTSGYQLSWGCAMEVGRMVLATVADRERARL